MALVNDSFDNLDQWLTEGTSATIVSGRLELTSRMSPPIYGDILAVEQLPVGDFDIIVDWEIDSHPSADFYAVSLIVYQTFGGSGGSGVQAYLSHECYPPDPSYYFGNFDGSTEDWLMESDTSGKLRIKRVGLACTLYCYRGGSWQSILSNSDYGDGPVQVYLRAQNASSTTSTVAYFDNFETGVYSEEPNEFTISGVLPQFMDDTTSPGDFIVSGALPQFSGELIISSFEFQVSGELPQFDGSILTAQGRTFSVVGSLPQFIGQISIAQGRAFVVAGKLPQFGGRIVVNHGKQFSISGRLPQFGGSISVWVKSDFSIAVGLPQFGGRIEFLGEVVALSVNVFHGGVCKYKGLDFNSIFIAEDGLCYVINDEGIHLVTGADDNGDEINAWFESGDLNLSIGQAVRMEDITILGRSEGDTMLTLFPNGEDTGENYVEAGDPSGNLYPNRFIPDKGIEGHTWRYRVSNVDGSGLSVQQLRMMYHDLSRKVS